MSRTPKLELKVLSLRYSSWSARAWLGLKASGVDFKTTTIDLLDGIKKQELSGDSTGAIGVSGASLKTRKELGSVTGLFPVLYVDGEPVHETLAILEFVADAFPEAKLWPDDLMARAYARSISTEMAAGFHNVRDQLSTHFFARAPARELRAATYSEVKRIQEIWRSCLAKYGGPFLFGRFSIADCMYYPVITRFRTYSVEIPEDLLPYCTAVEALPEVKEMLKLASVAPRIPPYDEFMRSIGGDPDALLKGGKSTL